VADGKRRAAKPVRRPVVRAESLISLRRQLVGRMHRRQDSGGAWDKVVNSPVEAQRGATVLLIPRMVVVALRWIEQLYGS
jgi:hypothetical protein